jgi:hypothetical protein
LFFQGFELLILRVDFADHFPVSADVAHHKHISRGFAFAFAFVSVLVFVNRAAVDRICTRLAVYDGGAFAFYVVSLLQRDDYIFGLSVCRDILQAVKKTVSRNIFPVRQKTGEHFPRAVVYVNKYTVFVKQDNIIAYAVQRVQKQFGLFDIKYFELISEIHQKKHRGAKGDRRNIGGQNEDPQRK